MTMCQYEGESMFTGVKAQCPNLAEAEGIPVRGSKWKHLRWRDLCAYHRIKEYESPGHESGELGCYHRKGRD